MSNNSGLIVELDPGKGSKGRGGDPGGSYWHILTNQGKRAGHIYINQIEDEYLGQHLTVSIEINKSMQSLGIGTEAYKLVIAKTPKKDLYLHMRKSNLASRKAAEKAGFKVIDVPNSKQLTMKS